MRVDIVLQEQGQTYLDEIKKILLAQGDSSPYIKAVFVLGEPIGEEGGTPGRLNSSMVAIPLLGGIAHYDSRQRSTASVFRVLENEQAARQGGKNRRQDMSGGHQGLVAEWIPWTKRHVRE